MIYKNQIETSIKNMWMEKTDSVYSINFNSYIHIHLDICSTQMPQESISTYQPKKIDWILPSKLTWQFSKWTKLEDGDSLLKPWGKNPAIAMLVIPPSINLCLAKLLNGAKGPDPPARSTKFPKGNPGI